MPFAYDGLLYIDGGRGAALVALRPGGVGDISLGKDQTSNEFVVWSQARAGTYLPSPVAYEGGVYVLTETGILTRFDSKTGKQTYKTRIDPAATAFTTSPWAYNGKLFCLSEEGQALWQFHSINTDAGRNNPKGPDGRPMGPDRYELRRMPVRRIMYQNYRDFMVDKANPFELASKDAGRGWRGRDRDPRRR